MTLPALAHGELATLPFVANPLTRKLSNFAPLSESDRQVLDALAAPDEQFAAHADLISEGMAPRSVFLLKEGMAIRYRGLPDGGRQIMTFLIPGDLCDLHVFLLTTMDHSIGAITPVRVARISRESMLDLFAHRPRISAALWWSALQEEATLRKRIVSLGRRDARGRIAYLLCELLWRHAAVGLTNGEIFRLPLTQTELGDTLGLTPVHVNRILKEFRERRLIAMEHRMLNLLDVAGLQRIADFNKDYLHLGGASDEVAEYFNALDRRQRSGDPIRERRCTSCDVREWLMTPRQCCDRKPAGHCVVLPASPALMARSMISLNRTIFPILRRRGFLAAAGLSAMGPNGWGGPPQISCG